MRFSFSFFLFVAYLHMTTNSPKTLPESIGLTPDFACLFVCLFVCLILHLTTNSPKTLPDF